MAPFLLFAVAGGAIPLPLTVLQLLAIDLGTDTLPALALSREAAEPGLMDRPPRPPKERLIRKSLLLRSWGFLGVISAALVIGAYLFTLHTGGWQPNAPTGAGTPLNHLYRQSTTVAWLGIVACQIGTAFAARTDRVSLRQIGVFTNRFLLVAIGVALSFAAVVVYVPAFQSIFGTAAPSHTSWSSSLRSPSSSGVPTRPAAGGCGVATGVGWPSRHSCAREQDNDTTEVVRGRTPPA